MSEQASAKTRFMANIGASALTAAAIAGSALGVAPAANATCASFFSIGNSADCTSTPFSVALAFGPGAQAQATGLFGAAFSIGDGASAKSPGLFSLASAVGTKARAEANGTFGAAMTAGVNSIVQTEDVFTLAAALGDNSLALGKGAFGIAAVLGPYTYAGTAGDPARGNLGFNIAVNVSPANKLPYSYQAGGIGNLAVNLFGTSDDPGGKFSYAYGLGSVVANLGGSRNELTSYGILSNASNMFGSNNKVTAASDKVNDLALNAAFTVFGSGNTVYAGPGPVAVAGSIAQTGATVAKQQPGVNINGIRIPNTAAAVDPQPAAAVTGRAANRVKAVLSGAAASPKPAAAQRSGGASSSPKPAAAQRGKPSSR